MSRHNHPERRIVNIDMDSVLFDFEGATTDALKQEFPEMELADPASHFQQSRGRCAPQKLAGF